MLAKSIHGYDYLFFHSATSGLENNRDNKACIVPVLHLNQITVGTSEQETLSVVLFLSGVGSRLQAGADRTLIYAYICVFGVFFSKEESTL